MNTCEGSLVDDQAVKPTKSPNMTVVLGNKSAIGLRLRLAPTMSFLERKLLSIFLEDVGFAASRFACSMSLMPTSLGKTDVTMASARLAWDSNFLRRFLVINFELRFWIQDPEGGLANIRSDVYMRIWQLFKENDIEIPFPQRDLHLRSSKQLDQLVELMSNGKA